MNALHDYFVLYNLLLENQNDRILRNIYIDKYIFTCVPNLSLTSVPQHLVLRPFTFICTSSYSCNKLLNLTTNVAIFIHFDEKRKNNSQNKRLNYLSFERKNSRHGFDICKKVRKISERKNYIRYFI